jgi:hypothetical protein
VNKTDPFGLWFEGINVDPGDQTACNNNCNRTWFDCFANCVERERFPFGVCGTLAGLTSAFGLGTMPKTGGELAKHLGPKEMRNPFTGQPSRWARRIYRLMGTPGEWEALRDFGRSRLGQFLGSLTTGYLVFEGFYDIGAIGRCVAVCDADRCSY